MKNKIILIIILTVAIILIGGGWWIWNNMWNNMQFAEFVESLPQTAPLSISDIKDKLCFGSPLIEIYRCEYNIYRNPAVGSTTYFDSQGNRIESCGLRSVGSPCRYLQKLKCESENICGKEKTNLELTPREVPPEEVPSEKVIEEVPVEKVINEVVPADWQSYRNTLWGYEIKYPKDFYLFTDRLNLNMVSISSEPNPWAQDIGPHQKVIIDIYRSENYKNYSLDYLLFHNVDFIGGQKIQIGENLAVRNVREEIPAIFTYFVRDDGYIYVLRGASGTNFNQYRNLIERIENTFKFVEKEEVLEPSGVEPSEKKGWWVYKNTKYKYTIEFPDEIGIEDPERILVGRLSESSRVVNFYLHAGVPNLMIEIPLTYDPEKESLSREEFINQFISINPKSGSIDATNIFNQMLSTFRFLE